MADETTPLVLQHPLREVARKERRALLRISTVGIIITWAGIIPKEIPAFGIKLSPINQAVIQWAVLGVILYFLIGFIIYAAADFVAWVYAARAAWQDEPERDGTRKAKETERFFRGPIVRMMLNVRTIFAIFIPIAVGVFALAGLFWKGWPSSSAPSVTRLDPSSCR